MNTEIMSFFNKEDIKEIVKEAIREEKELLKPIAQEQEELLTRKEAAAFLKVRLPTLWAWSKQGKLQRHYIGSRVYYKRQELLASLENIQSQKNKRG
jgi:hypothetical protein